MYTIWLACGSEADVQRAPPLHPACRPYFSFFPCFTLNTSICQPGPPSNTISRRVYTPEWWISLLVPSRQAFPERGSRILLSLFCSWYQQSVLPAVDSEFAIVSFSLCATSKPQTELAFAYSVVECIYCSRLVIANGSGALHTCVVCSALALISRVTPSITILSV